MSYSQIEGSLATYTLKRIKNNKITLECRSKEQSGSGSFLMLSAKDPERESENLLGKFWLKEGILVIIFGCAHIYLLKKLKEHQAKYGGMILTIDADPIFANWLKKIFVDVFHNVPLFTPENDFLISELLENIYIENLLGYRFFKNPTSIKLNRDYYHQIESSFKKHLSSRFSDLFTRLEFEPRWIINSISQIPYFHRARPIKVLFDRGEKQTAILVSTGPSLRQSLEFIKKNQERFFIACVDSAYRILARNNIIPHLVMTLDSQPFTIRHFLGLPLGDINKFPMLCADLVANPQVIRLWKGPIFYSITAQYAGTARKTTPGSGFVEQKACESNEELSPGLGDIQSGGSVATSLFDLLRQMKFESILLAGQDLAFSYREIHCTGTHHTDIWTSKNIHRLESLENISEKTLRKRHTIYENSIQNKKIKADYVFSLYKNWFVEAISRVSTRVYNVTKEGLKIDSTLPFDLKKISDSSPSSLLFKKLLVTDRSFILDKSKCLDLLNHFLQDEYSPNLREKFSFMNRVGRWHEIQKQRTKIANSQSLDPIESENHVQTNTEHEKLKIRKQEKFWKKLQTIVSRSKRHLLEG